MWGDDKDKITCTILEDGTIRWEVDGDISAPNHSSADEFLAEVGRLVGGAETIEHKHGYAAHSHRVDHGVKA